MRRKENLPNSNNSNTNCSIIKNGSRKHSALGLQEQQKQTSRQFKPRFIMKSKETPTNRFVDSRQDNECYEYDDVHETYRRFEEERREMERLKMSNSELRGKVLKLNKEYQLMKEKNGCLERELEEARGHKISLNVVPPIPLYDCSMESESQLRGVPKVQSVKFAGAISTITGVLEQIQESLMNEASTRTGGAHRKIQKLLQCLKQYSK